MRLLHVSPFFEPAPGYGGMARASAALCRALVDRGHDVTVATALLELAVPREECREGIHIHRFAGPSLLRGRRVPWAPGLSEWLVRKLPSTDVVHLHGHRNGLSVVAARAAARAGIPTVLQLHGTYPHHGQHRLAKRLFDRIAGDAVVAGAVALVAVSDAEARDLPAASCLVPNGVQRLPAEGARPLRERAEGALLFVGNGARQKRGELLPAILHALPRTTLRLVGRFGTSFRRRLECFGSRVMVSGTLHDQELARAYAEARLIVHPAVGEAFGLVPFEGAFHGTAAVVAGGHGCGDWYGRAGGCVVPPDDPATLLREVRRRLDDPALASDEAQAVARFAGRELTWAAAAEAVERVYAQVRGVGRRGAA